MDTNIQRCVWRLTSLKRSFRPPFSLRCQQGYSQGTEFSRTCRAMANYRATIYFHEKLVSFLHTVGVERPTVALEELITKSKRGEVLEKT